MPKWLTTLKRELVEKHLFDRTASGETIYVPYGTANLLARRTFIVPDDQVRDRIVAIHRRWIRRSSVIFIGSLAVMVAALAVLPVDRRFPPIAFGIAMVVILAAVLGSALAAMAEARKGLVEGPRRTFRHVLAIHDRDFGPSRRGPWLWSFFVLGLFAVELWAAYEEFTRGRIGLAIGLAVIFAVFIIPMLALGPYVLRMRRLRAENERLEQVVRERTRELQELNRTLENRVQEQVQHIERLGQLKHFFAAPVAEMILNDKGFDPAKVHRRELTAVSIDLRGFTAFSETSEPEEVISVLRVYHAELGIQVNRCQATLEHFAGDGVMLFLNDPVELPDHPMRAIELAVALRDAMRPHLDEWKANGFDIGLGIGIATGYATIGAVGYEGRWEYAAIGTVCNLAARLCAEAKDGQIVVSKRFISRLGDRARFEALGERALKGLSRPVAAFNVVALNERVPETA
jgi:class 3 adenylate cyclase